MPLVNSSSASALRGNIATEVRAGRPQAQAVAIALSTGRRAWRRLHPTGSFPHHLRRTGAHRASRSNRAGPKKLVCRCGAYEFPHMPGGGACAANSSSNRAGNLPQWTGASAVYSYLYKVLEQLSAEEWSRTRAAAKKRGRKPHGMPTDEMKEIIEALNRGDEETLKAIQMKYKLGHNRAGEKLPAHPIGDPLLREHVLTYGGDYVLVYGGGAGRGFAVSKPYVLKDMAIDEAKSLSRPGSYGGEVRIAFRDGSRTVEVGRARNGQFHAADVSANRAAIQSVGDPDPETKSYHAAMIDETQHVNKDMLVRGTPFKASQIDKVYEVIVFTLDERVHLASLTASTYYEPIYYLITGKDGYFPEDDEEREKWHEMEDALTQESEPSYIDHSYAQKIAKRDKSRVKNIGDFESIDDAREHARGNYPF